MIATHKKMRILIIDDNADLAEAMCEVLSLSGHDVIISGDGQGSLVRAREFHPDIVLCDIGLPGMDGYRVAQAFRDDDEFKDIRLVAVSGYAMPEDIIRAREAGFDSHLAKPINLFKLEAALSL